MRKIETIPSKEELVVQHDPFVPQVKPDDIKWVFRDHKSVRDIERTNLITLRGSIYMAVTDSKLESSSTDAWMVELYVRPVFLRK